jgi:hypothetical protein
MKLSEAMATDRMARTGSRKKAEKALLTQGTERRRTREIVHGDPERILQRMTMGMRIERRDETIDALPIVVSIAIANAISISIMTGEEDRLQAAGSSRAGVAMAEEAAVRSGEEGGGKEVGAP